LQTDSESVGNPLALLSVKGWAGGGGRPGLFKQL
jgi:hypothetical protein